MDNVWARFFPIFSEKDLLKVDKILGLTFFQSRKDFEGFKTAFFYLLLLSFVVDGLFTTPVYSPQRAVLWTQKNLAQKRSLFMTKKFDSKSLQKFYVSSKHEKECYKKMTSYLEEPNRHFSEHFMRIRTTQQTFSAINLASQQKPAKLFFSSQVRKHFKLLAVPFKSLRCCLQSDKLVNCHVWKFCKDLFLNCRVSSWPDLSIKSYLWMVSSLILFRSLRVYILKQLLFSISVNSGFWNILPLFTSISKYNC